MPNGRAAAVATALAVVTRRSALPQHVWVNLRLVGPGVALYFDVLFTRLHRSAADAGERLLLGHRAFGDHLDVTPAIGAGPDAGNRHRLTIADLTAELVALTIH